MGKGVLIAALLIIGGMCYLSYRGVTFQVARTWVEQQLGIGQAGPDFKSVPHNYGPVIVPGR